MSYSAEEIKKLNAELKQKSPVEIAQWAVDNAVNAVVTTNFRPYEAAILYAATQAKKRYSCDLV